MVSHEELFEPGAAAHPGRRADVSPGLNIVSAKESWEIVVTTLPPSILYGVVGP